MRAVPALLTLLLCWVSLSDGAARKLRHKKRKPSAAAPLDADPAIVRAASRPPPPPVSQEEERLQLQVGVVSALFGGEEWRRQGPVVIGIDFGASNSAVAAASAGRVEVIANGLGSRVTPSVVAFSAGGHTKGGRRLVGEAAAAAAAAAGSAEVVVVLGAKGLLGRKYAEPAVTRWSGGGAGAGISGLRGPAQLVEHDGAPHISLAAEGAQPGGGGLLSAPQLSAEVLGALKATAEAHLGRAVAAAVLTVPAHFNDAQRQAHSSRRRDCHSRILLPPPPPFSRCFDRDGEGGVSIMTVLADGYRPHETRPGSLGCM